LSRFDGHEWRDIAPISAQYESIWGSTDEDIFVSGSGGVMLHFDGNGWTLDDAGILSSEAAVTDMWGCSSGWVVGVTDAYETDAAILLFDGEEWKQSLDMPSLATQLSAIWVDSNCGIAIAVGRSGRILRGVRE
jgi:hypothetical protein